AIAAAFPALLPDVSAFIRQVRITVMPAARSWPQGRKDVLEAVYRIIYGGRAALEEALIQNSSDAVPPLTLIEDASGSGPSVVINGVRVHSGDIVLSRGGAPTSALIARGNDFPGNFSHAALVHVDSDSGRAVAVESLIERGAVVSSLEDYLEEKRLRILLLRLRPDHPVVGDDPLAIHRAATDMLHLVRNGGIGYDFSMNWEDPGRFFCSEVPYHAYRSLGIDLWAHRSRISSPGLAEWLGGMGVRHFTTIIPSDIEYDPRLAAVAEWRNPETLRQDRFDNVVIDALLAGAEEGDRLDYPFYRLPLARLIKGWSYLQWKAGVEPLIPEGMTPGAALRVNAL
ncbi:MAG TPA: YiiX/YebB-like N1pC/P60 family cysteine hydrolase, partial [Nitrospiria bacterium]|nr:YiiX/YebB-like N1pC/P60 family cysteine hydrolase [Nitrospiria bacterium]